MKQMHFVKCAALAAVFLFTTLTEKFETLFSSAEVGNILNLFLNFEQK